MTWNRIVSAAGLILPVLGIALALGNWGARPDKALAWATVTVILVGMLLVRLVAERAVRGSSDPATIRNIAAVPRAVVVGAVMVVIPLAVSLAHAYGLVSDRESGFHATMIIIGLYLAAIGNALPRSLPPTASMPGNAAQIQAFQRFAGWTWTLGGLGFAAAWLVLPKDAAVPVSVAVVGGALVLIVIQLMRLRKPRGTTLPT
jgi:hypothetical protein